MASPSDLVTRTLVKDILKKQDNVISTDSSALLSEAFTKIVEQGISSVPVFSTVENRYSSFIDVLDISMFVVSLIETHNDLEKVKEVFNSTTVGELKDFQRVHRNWAGNFVDNLNSTDTLKRAMNIMVNLVNIHRLPTFTLSGDLVGVLSQSDIVYTLASNIHLFPIANKRVKDIGLGIKAVISVPQDATLRDAFSKIKEHKISGIAVVDENEQLVGSVSAADIKIIDGKAHSLDKLSSPVKDFKGDKKTVTVTTDLSIQEVFEKFAHERAHRAFVIGQNFKLVGVITLIDLLELILNYI